jgi:hypothetical protein
MKLFALGEHSLRKRNPDRAAEIACRVDQRGGLVRFHGDNSVVGRDADRNEHERQAEPHDHPRKGEKAEGRIRIEARQHVHSTVDDHCAERDEIFWLDETEASHDEHHGHRHKAAGRKRFSGELGLFGRRSGHMGVNSQRSSHGRDFSSPKLPG